MAEFVERKSYLAEAPVALVIGCGGLGMSVARLLGQRHPLLMVDIDADRLEQCVDALQVEGYAASGHQCDIVDPGQTQALGAALMQWPGVRVLAHIAAVGSAVQDWRKMMAVDLIGPHLIAEAVRPHMVRGAVAVFVGSLAGYLPRRDPKIDVILREPLSPGFFDRIAEVLGSDPSWVDTYGLAKLGVIHLAEKLAIEWGRTEVRALSVSPGMINSAMARAQGATLPSHKGDGRDVPRSEKAREVPLAREGSVLEVASAIAFLASDAASFINGIDIVVDGGHRAAWRATGVITR